MRLRQRCRTQHSETLFEEGELTGGPGGPASPLSPLGPMRPCVQERQEGNCDLLFVISNLVNVSFV